MNMNLSKIPVFTLLVFIFWSFSGFAQSGELKKEKTKIPEFKNPLKQEAKTENAQDTKTDKDKVDKEADKEADKKKISESKNEKKAGEKTKGNKTDTKKQTSSKTDQSTSTPSDNSSSPSKSKDIKNTKSSAKGESVQSQTQEQKKNKNNSDKFERIEVTGSRIKQVDVEGPSPVLVLDRDYLNRTGFNNIGDVLRETTVATFGGSRETSLIGGASTGASTTSLRGFGADRVLVLLDGKRLPTIGGSTSVDLSLVPMAAVERVEILKDGASAIYGSDALGGVVNIITKKDYDGASFNLGYNLVEMPGGNRADIKASYGKNFDKGHFLGVLQVRSNEGVNSRDTYYARPKPDAFSPNGSPGSYQPVGGKWTPDKSCPEDRVVPFRGDSKNGYVCGLDYSQWSQVTPDINQYNALLSGSYELNDLSLFARGIYTHRDVNSVLAPPPDRFRDASKVGGLNTQISGSTAQGWGLGGPLKEIRYRLVEEGGSGPRVSEVISDSFNIQSGVTGSFFNTWEWEFSGVYGASNTTNEGVSGYANKKVLFEAAQANPSSFNPFNPPGSKSDLKNIPGALYKPLDTIKSSMATLNFMATGELPVNLPAGPLALAVGVSTAWQTYEQTNDPITGSGAQWGGGASAIGNGDREIQSTYMEFSAPVLNQLEVQAAGRFDNFSDFGSTINPKLALKYGPFNMLLLRASWGTGYRAPSLSELYQTQTTGFPFGRDPITGQVAQFETMVGGNPDLKEETSQSLNVGAVIDMGEGFKFLEGLNITLDYWVTSVKNGVSSPSLRNIFDAEEKFGNDYLNNFGLSVNRNPDKSIDTIVAPSVNLSKSDISGMDIRLSYLMPKPLFGFRFRAIVDQSLLFNLMVEPFPGLPREQRTGFAGIPYWKNNVILGLSNQTFDFSTTIRSIGKTNSDSFSPKTSGKTRDHTELDFRVQYNAPWNGSFSFLVRNILNTKRPLYINYLSNGYLDTSLYDPFGRTFGLFYTHNF